MRANRSRGPSGMRAEHLRRWFREARKAEEGAKVAVENVGETEAETATVAEVEAETEATEMTMMEMYHWQKVVALVQAHLQEGRLVEESTS